jgi:hypothetical protein
MIQLIFESKGKVTLGWEDEQEQLVFRLSPTGVERGDSLHKQEVGAAVPSNEAMGAITLHYDGDVARQVRIILELPDEVWDNLANWTDDLLDKDLLPDEDWEDEENWDDDD